MNIRHFRNSLIAGSALVAVAIVGSVAPAQAVISSFSGTFSSVTEIGAGATPQLADPAATEFTSVSSNINPGSGVNAYTAASGTGGGLDAIIASLAGLTLDTGNGIFTATSVILNTASGFNTSTQTRTIELNGLLGSGGGFTPSGALTGNPATDAALVITMNQTGGAGQAISASYTLASQPLPPPPGVPEPTTIALLGVALAGLGAARRRARKN